MYSTLLTMCNRLLRIYFTNLTMSRGVLRVVKFVHAHCKIILISYNAILRIVKAVLHMLRSVVRMCSDNKYNDKAVQKVVLLVLRLVRIVLHMLRSFMNMCKALLNIGKIGEICVVCMVVPFGLATKHKGD